jgi:hypothetical protein
MEKGHKKPAFTLSNPAGFRSTYSKKRLHPAQFSPRHSEQPGRLAQPKYRSQELPIASESFSAYVPDVPFQTTGGRFCKSVEPSIAPLSQLENRPPQPGKRMGLNMEQAIMDQPPMGAHSSSPPEDSGRPDMLSGLPACVAECPLVEAPPPPTGGSDGNSPSPPPFRFPHRRAAAPTTLGNPFHGAAGMTHSDLIRNLRLLEIQTDIPPPVRVHWLMSILPLASSKRDKMHVNQCIKRISQQAKQPKYPLFYSIHPLVEWAFQPGEPFDMSRFIVQLRLTTLMRSCDVANITWALFVSDGKYFIRTVDKKGAPLLFSVAGSVLRHVIQHLHAHLLFPNPRLIRSRRRSAANALPSWP